jgi:hypothetical protein
MGYVHWLLEQFFLAEGFVSHYLRGGLFTLR